MATVRLTIRPDEDTEVPDEELPVLRQQGLLIENEPSDAPGTPPAVTTRAGTPAPSSASGAEDED